MGNIAIFDWFDEFDFRNKNCLRAFDEALIRASAEGLSGGQPSQLQEVLEVLKHLKCEDELNNNI